jgi:anti-anti-sigma factor
VAKDNAMPFHIETVNDVTVVTIPQKRATAEIAREFKDFLFDLIENQGSVKMVMNLRDVQFMDSFFLGAVVSGLKRMRSQGGDIKLVSLQHSLRPVFDLMHLDQVFSLYDNLPDAINSF